MKVVCAECMKMCCLGGKNSVVKGLKYGVIGVKDLLHALTWTPAISFSLLSPSTQFLSSSSWT